ncbi:MAG: SHOCT domain-containing protein [Candidatus Nanopelagicales bacterium]
MRLVPRQLQRTGMTGQVPYYGGRITPTVAYAIEHPDAPPQAQWSPAYQMGRPPAPVPPPPPPAGPDRAATLAQLDALLASGVITREEHDALAARVAP